MVDIFIDDVQISKMSHFPFLFLLLKLFHQLLGLQFGLDIVWYLHSTLVLGQTPLLQVLFRPFSSQTLDLLVDFF